MPSLVNNLWPPFFFIIQSTKTKTKKCRSGFRATLNFRKTKVPLNCLTLLFFKLCKSCILTCLLQFDNKLSYLLRVFLTAYTVVMATFWVMKMTITCSPVFGPFIDTIIVLALIHQRRSTEKMLETFMEKNDVRNTRKIYVLVLFFHSRTCPICRHPLFSQPQNSPQ